MESRWAKWRREHPEETRKYKEACQERSVARKTKLVSDWLSSHPCIDCGETDPIVLEFDHIIPKSHGVREVIQGWGSIKRLLSEMAKCEIRCANCHKRRHYKLRN
jgi:5-methylcytosine-specific restriction endonuclease McrA